MRWMDLLVKDILNRPYFNQADVIAGKKGLNRSIKWVHIVEIETFGHLLNGQELILTTGMGWIHDQQKSLNYLQQLIDHHASALCIELPKGKQIPKGMITLAEKHQFPIILFKEEVKFIDITRDIHRLLLKYEENTWLKLEQLYKNMHQNLIQNGSIEQFLSILYQGIQKPVALIDQDQHIWVFPPSIKNMKVKNQLSQADYYPSVPVYLLDDVIAHLYILHQNLTNFDQLAMNRCSELLSQYFWKYQQKIDIQEVKKNEWLLKAITNQLSKDYIIKQIRQQKEIDLTDFEAIIGVLPLTKQPLPSKLYDPFFTSVLMALRMAFEQEIGQIYISKNEQHYIFLMIHPENILNHLKNTLTSMREKDSPSLLKDHLKYLSFGKVIYDLEDISSSYQTALMTLEYQQDIAPLNDPFYQTLGLYRLLRSVQPQELQDIIKDYIGPLLKYDEEKGTELVKTLKVFLKHSGAKNQTAEDLYIVRQTLYHRLERIESLIGHDFMEPEKRLMIEFAIYALYYFERTK